jgi:hypothetical protein
LPFAHLVAKEYSTVLGVPTPVQVHPQLTAPRGPRSQANRNLAACGYGVPSQPSSGHRLLVAGLTSFGVPVASVYPLGRQRRELSGSLAQDPRAAVRSGSTPPAFLSRTGRGANVRAFSAPCSFCATPTCRAGYGFRAYWPRLTSSRRSQQGIDRAPPESPNRRLQQMRMRKLLITAAVAATVLCGAVALTTSLVNLTF